MLNTGDKVTIINPNNSYCGRVAEVSLIYGEAHGKEITTYVILWLKVGNVYFCEKAENVLIKS